MNVVDFNEITVGYELSPLTKPPITRATLAYFCGASNDHNPIHVDIDFARAAGEEDVFAHGMLDMAYLGQLLTAWVPQAAIASFEVKFGAMVRVGDAITCRGQVVEKLVDERQIRLKIKLMAEDQSGEIKLTGEAEVRQSRRQHGG